jgi:prevent-host-death family protein
MRIAPVAEVKAKLSAYVDASRGGPVVITRNGKPVAVLLEVGDEDDLEGLLLAHSPRLRAVLEAGRKQLQAGSGMPHDEFWAEMNKPVEKPLRRTGRRKRA